MELNNAVRNRRVGFLGVAIATLLTPAGKLISSAVAAGVTMALVTTTVSDGTTGIEIENAELPQLATSSAAIPDYFEMGMSELTISEPAAELLATRENSNGMMLASMPSMGVLSNSANGPSGGNLSEIPAMGVGFGPPPIIITGDPADPKGPNCEQVLKKDPSERTEEEKVCEVIPEIIALVPPVPEAPPPVPEAIPETNNPSVNPPPLIVSNTPPEEEQQRTPEKEQPRKPDDEPKKWPLPSEPVSSPTGEFVAAAAIPEPSTIGLLLLGLIGLGWITRRNTGA